MTFPPPFVETAPLAWTAGEARKTLRALPEEVPIALTFDGSTYAVMMATPRDVTDFATGFAFTEDIIDSLDEIDSLETVEVEGGIEARFWLKPSVSQRHRARRRSILGPTGCGLCGAESVAQALKPVARVRGDVALHPREIASAMALLQSKQRLHAKTKAVHAAAFYAGGEIVVREDVGRHNALDKVIGAVLRQGRTAGEGTVLLTSRVSIELVQKTAKLGAPLIAAVSAPTALAVRAAESAGITLAAIVRNDDFEVFTYPERIVWEACANAG